MDFAQKRHVNLKSTLMEHSIPFYTLVNFVDAEDIVKKNSYSWFITEVINVTWKRESQKIVFWNSWLKSGNYVYRIMKVYLISEILWSVQIIQSLCLNLFSKTTR